MYPQITAAELGEKLKSDEKFVLLGLTQDAFERRVI